MKRTKDTKLEMDKEQVIDYLQEYYDELVDSEVPSKVKETILNNIIGI